MPPRIYDGSGTPAPERVTLRAGKLTLTYEAGTLRYIRLGRHELVRSIYAAVRDHNWGTIPAVLHDVVIEAGDDSFAVSFIADHHESDLHFMWRGTITGTADGTITFSFEGTAHAGCLTNRVGFCVLHPMEVAGRAVTIEHASGEREHSAFPQDIAPHRPFFDLRAITHEVAPGVLAEVRMEGDTFEMEDQRNWTDASFKTYCTPLAQPFPRLIETGGTVMQTVTLRLIGDVATVEVSEPAPTLHLNTSVSRPLPKIGLCTASHNEPLSNSEIERLKPLQFDHLRVDIDFSEGWKNKFEQAWRTARALDATLSVVALLARGGEAEAQLRAAAELWRTHQVSGWLMGIQDGEVTTSDTTLALMNRLLPQDVILASGTDGYFTQLNRSYPPQSADVVVYSVNPQVHAFDNASLVETLPALASTVATARTFAPHSALAVSPITFKIRRNPDATAPEAPTPLGQLPRQVDPRQMSLFGAGWTMGAIASLASTTVDSLTFYETTGWLGIMERESGSPLPDLFPSIPGGVFPMYHVFADVGEMGASAVLLGFPSSQPLVFSGLALRAGAQLRLLIANHTQARQTVTITGIHGAWRLKSLDERTADAAMRDPEGYRAEAGRAVTAGDDGLRVDLLPYAVVRLDQDSTP